MRTATLEKQLEPVTSGREKMARARVGKNTVFVLSEAFFRRVQPLLDYVANRPGAAPSSPGTEWSEKKNARRVALINQKNDQVLTAAEKKELARLQKEADEFRDRVAPARNEILELALAGLKAKAAKKRGR